MQTIDYFNILWLIALLGLGSVVFVAVSMFVSFVLGIFDYDE